MPEPLSTASSSSNTNPQNTTRLIEGIDNVLNTELKFFSNARKRIDTCMNYTRPELAIALEQTNKAFLDAKGRSVVLRYITEITKDNISYCKELMTMVNELRHLDGIKGNFMLSETEYLAPIILFEKGKIASQIIYSNQKEIADQHQYMFDTLWNKAVSAEQRIKEIEEGVEHTETRVLKIKTEIFSYMKSIAENADEQSTCCSIGGMQLVHNYFFDEYKRIVDRSRGREKESKGVRWITSIDKDSINLVNVFLDSGMQVRHLKNLTHVDFAVDNKNFNATVDKMEGGKLMESLLISNEPAYVSHYNSVFEELWKNGIDAKERIKDIEQGLDLEYIEVIPSSAKAQERYLDIVKSASEEILWIFPTTNAFIRQDKMGAIPLAIQAARERNIKVKILVPANNVIEQKVQQLKEYCHSCQIDVKYIEQMSETKATILVIDRKASLVMELKDDTKLTFHEAIGLTTYSNSKAGVLSYVAIFDNLWKQSDLYEQLKRHDKMQKELINIAAHELRTPIQPIIGLSEVVLANTKDTEQARLLEVINRNAKRLHRLTEDILDVTKIETQSLNLNKEQFNLNEVITNAIEDLTTKKVFSSSSMKAKNPTIKLLNNQPAQDVSIYADKVRISQVVSNLLDNTVKFTKAAKGNITIMINKEGEGQNNNNQQVIVSIKDTGTGIDPEILPKLFTKFATKSQTGGTGLGLFICKGIIEAHGGRIWAENNKDGEKGATFYFTLPLSR